MLITPASANLFGGVDRYVPPAFEMADAQGKVQVFPVVPDEMRKGGRVTLEKARVMDSRADRETGRSPEN